MYDYTRTWSVLSYLYIPPCSSFDHSKLYSQHSHIQTGSPGCNVIIHTHSHSNSKAFGSILGWTCGHVDSRSWGFEQQIFRLVDEALEVCILELICHTCAAHFQTSIHPDRRNAADINVLYLHMVSIHCELRFLKENTNSVLDQL